MAILRYWCILICSISVAFPSLALANSALTQAVFNASQLEKRCEPSFKQYERFKSANRLLELDSSRPRWVGIESELRKELNMVIDSYNKALDKGVSESDSELKKVKTTINNVHERMKKCGVWTSFRWEDPKLSGGARTGLDKIRAKAWEGTLFVQLGMVDEASSAFAFSHELISEISEAIERDLDRGVKPEDYRNHPAYKRTLAEVERLESSVQKEFAQVEKARNKLKQDVDNLSGVVDECTPFIRSADSLRLSGTEDQILEDIRTFSKKLESFNDTLRKKAETTVTTFGETYGTDSDAISASIKRIMGNKPFDGPKLPQGLYSRLNEYLATADKIPGELSDKLLRIAKRNSETNAVDPAIREKSFELAKECLILAIELDPENEDVKTLYGRLGGDIKAAAKKADAYLDAGTWEPHIKGFQGPGNPNKLAESALDWLKNDPGWTKSKDPLAVRINGDWRVAKKNLLGEPLTWGLPIEAAFITHKDRESDRDAAVVFSLTIVTSETDKSPPWKATWVGSNRQMRASNVKTFSGSSGPNILFRLILVGLLVCSGILLAGSRLKVPEVVMEKLGPVRPIIGVATLAAGLIFLFFNLLSPLSDILPQVAGIVAGLFLGLELLLKKPTALAAAEGDALTDKAGRNVDDAIKKTQEFLAKNEQRIRKLEQFQIPMGITCLVLALLHLVAGGFIFV